MDSAILGSDGTIRCPKCGATGLQPETSGVLSRALLRCLACRGKFQGAKPAKAVKAKPATVREALFGVPARRAPTPPPPPAVGWAPPTGPPVQMAAGRTLRLLRQGRSMAAATAILAVRPDLSRAQVRALFDAAMHTPQPLIIDRSPGEIDYAAVLLRNAGVAFDVV